MTAGYEHRLRLQLRWRDIDRLGHLNQAVYHELLEEVRFALVSELLGRAGETRGAWVVVRVELDYLTEVRKDHNEVDVIARVGRLGTTSLRIDHEVVHLNGTVAASGCTVLVAWDRDARRKRPITDGERAALTAV